MTKKNSYTVEQIEYLRTGYLLMNIRSLTLAFNAHFGVEKTDCGIKSALVNRRITCRRKVKDRLVKRTRLCTMGQERFLRDNYVERSLGELTATFNDRVGSEMTEQQIKTFMGNHGITSGRPGT